MVVDGGGGAGGAGRRRKDWSLAPLAGGLDTPPPEGWCDFRLQKGPRVPGMKFRGSAGTPPGRHILGKGGGRLSQRQWHGLYTLFFYYLERC